MIARSFKQYAFRYLHITGRGFVSKELTNGHKFPEGATLELHMTENNDSDGEYCYGRVPDGT